SHRHLPVYQTQEEPKYIQRTYDSGHWATKLRKMGSMKELPARGFWPRSQSVLDLLRWVPLSKPKRIVQR
ncbi:MAG: hypothetical protein ACRD5G_13915, partial [Candidatus Acidiferrales bacterium]